MATGNISSISLKHTATSSKWHTSDNIQYFPRTKQDFSDLDQLAKQFVFKDAGPIIPIFSPNDKILTIGSCFASRLREWLKANNKNADFIDVPDQLNSTYALKQYLEWVLTGNRSSDAYSYTVDKNGDMIKWESKLAQEVLLEYIKHVKGIVITIGTAEVWKDSITNGVFWRGIPEDVYDPLKHNVVVSSVDDNLKNLNEIYRLLKTYTSANLIFTLSPVPLNATYTNRPCMISDCVSKSILRVALDQFFSQQLNNTYYWPSFEFVKWTAPHLEQSTMFPESKSARHVNEPIVKIIISNFIERFFK